MTLRSLESYFVWLVFYGFVGWVWETLLFSVKAKRFINRGFLNGPYCPIYGFGAVLVLLVLGWVRSVPALFVLSALLTCSLEYFTSWAMEKLFHARWWDYSQRRFNLHGRVCLLGAVVFGTFSVVLIRVLHPPVASLTARLPDAALHGLAAALLLLLAVDTAVTVKGLGGFNEHLRELAATLRALEEAVPEKLQTARDREMARVRAAHEEFLARLNGQQKRILQAFPRLRSLPHEDALREFREFLNEKRAELRAAKKH